jgi:hypothetical protein
MEDAKLFILFAFAIANNGWRQKIGNLVILPVPYTGH